MLFARLNRTDPEKVFIIARNSWSSADLVNGYLVQWDFTTDKDGVGVTQQTGMATNLGNACAGVCVDTITPGQYGLIQVYGYHAAVRANACTSADVIALGSGIRPSLAGGDWNCEGHDPDGDLNYHCIGFALETYALWTSTTIKAFIKAM